MRVDPIGYHQGPLEDRQPEPESRERVRLEAEQGQQHDQQRLEEQIQGRSEVEEQQPLVEHLRPPEQAQLRENKAV